MKTAVNSFFNGHLLFLKHRLFHLGYLAGFAALLLVVTGCDWKVFSLATFEVKVVGRWTNSLGMVFVKFERPAIAFSIWETRVQDFAAFVNDTGYTASVGMMSLNERNVWSQVGRTWRNPGFEQSPTHPVVGVSWNDAQAFCVWLTKKEQAAGRLTRNQVYRLPTDEEWSVAVGLPPETETSPWAKSQDHTDRRMQQYPQSQGKVNNSRNPFDVYPWGTAWPPPTNAGNYAAAFQVDAFPFTAPVGSFPPNQLGLYDLGGNVWEWCEDRIAPQAEQRVWRGASFTCAPAYSTTRAFAVNSDCRADLGFRLVLATSTTN